MDLLLGLYSDASSTHARFGDARPTPGLLPRELPRAAVRIRLCRRGGGHCVRCWVRCGLWPCRPRRAPPCVFLSLLLTSAATATRYATAAAAAPRIGRG